MIGYQAHTVAPPYTAPSAAAATEAAMDQAMNDFVLNMHLIRRPGTVDDIAACALYLAGDESSWVTGQNFCIDGGVTAGYR